MLLSALAGSPVWCPQFDGDSIEIEVPGGAVCCVEVDFDAIVVNPVVSFNGLGPQTTMEVGVPISSIAGTPNMVVMDDSVAAEKGMTPMARIIDYITTGTKPELIMEAPIDASRKLLDRNKLTIDDIDLFEHNEAFSTASIAVQRALSVPDSKFNVNGGAVALGHPIGCSGARVLTTLIYAMKNRDAHRGLATLCLGGGNAVAMLVER